MRNLIIIALLILQSGYTSYAFAGAAEQKSFGAATKYTKLARVKPEKLYCSLTAKTKYKVLISGTNIKITRLYKEYVDVYKGTLKNGKIYSNDPEEKRSKVVWGKYYKLKGNDFGVLNIANGDYEWYTLCKK